MSPGPQKHSLTLHGHRTSVTLEAEFWLAFREIAAVKGIAINQLAAEIDEHRDPGEGLASAIRVFCLRHFRKMKGAVEKG
ncbi:ribbon-helix-helix domain-containing protein [Pseudogemmobacter humi]|nr:ribbon-helix-helix domain-containing protein [Pseudogemmobacter humi]